MLSSYAPQNYSTYGFLFKGRNSQQIAGIHTLGWEIRKSSSYYWDGTNRSEIGKIIFQYTLKGEGEIKIHDQTIRLKPGTAFFVDIPSDHQYYLPVNSEKWEFIHLTLFGEESKRIFQEITEEYGNILTLDVNAVPIQLIFNLYEKAVHNEIKDGYDASGSAYLFLMELQRYIIHNNRPNSEIPHSITKATHFIRCNYDKPISLDDIVEAAGLSKYHFSRLFNQTMGTSPLDYVASIRINKAIELLKNESLTIEDISVKVGYSNGNYFSKVFRSIVGVSPGKYRNNREFIPFDKTVRG